MLPGAHRHPLPDILRACACACTFCAAAQLGPCRSAPSGHLLGFGQHQLQVRPGRTPCLGVQAESMPGGHTIRVAEVCLCVSPPRRSPEHALVIGHRLQSSARRLSGVAPRLFAFANQRTVQLLRHRGGPEAWEVS